jgi:MinD-like ATPase involved in chromosome partitioning or flagellar assembly
MTGYFLDFFVIDTPTGMFHIKFLFISYEYNRLISVSSESVSLEHRLHVNYLNTILYKYLV